MSMLDMTDGSSALPAGMYTSTPEDRRAAVRAVASAAVNAPDLTHLLDVLGLDAEEGL